MKRKQYEATVERDARFWFVEVPGVGVTQARHLRELDTMTRDLVVVMTGATPKSFDVDYDIRLPRSVRRHLDRAEQLRARSATAQRDAADELRAAARELSESGLSLRDVGVALGVSHQRAHQLVR